MIDQTRAAVRDVTTGPDRLYVNDERTVLVTIWAGGTVTVATRETPGHVWGPPVYLKETK